MRTRLTSEILEKNGFYYINDEFPAYYLDSFKGGVALELRVLMPHLDDLEEYECDDLRIIYVDELQHALESHGIEKTIEL